MKKETLYVVYTLIGFVAGIIMGRQNFSGEQSVRYVKGETIERVVEIPMPYKVEVAAQPIYLYKKTDTVLNPLTAEIDTAAILNDWITKKSYQQNLFDNQHGKLSVDASIQYNKLESLKYNFTPIQKEISITKQPVWMPYVGISYSSLNYVGVGGGIFYHNIGMGARYVTDFNRKGFDFELKYKF